MTHLKQIADLTTVLEWKNDMPFFRGKLLKYDHLAHRLRVSEVRIAQLEDTLNRKPECTLPEEATP